MVLGIGLWMNYFSSEGFQNLEDMFSGRFHEGLKWLSKREHEWRFRSIKTIKAPCMLTFCKFYYQWSSTKISICHLRWNLSSCGLWQKDKFFYFSSSPFLPSWKPRMFIPCRTHLFTKTLLIWFTAMYSFIVSIKVRSVTSILWVNVILFLYFILVILYYIIFI